jgi:hypothetical protein
LLLQQRDLGSGSGMSGGGCPLLGAGGYGATGANEG